MGKDLLGCTSNDSEIPGWWNYEWPDWLQGCCFFSLYVYFILSPMNFYEFSMEKNIYIFQSSCTFASEAKIMRATRESTDNERAKEWTLFLETLVVKTRRKGFKNICGIQLLRWSICALEKRKRQQCKKRRTRWGDD